MGDHRAECKIEFKFHDKTYNLHLDWINWDELDGDCTDSRVRTFFEESCSDGLARYERKVAAYHAEQNKVQIEREEREQLKRLKEKYESG